MAREEAGHINMPGFWDITVTRKDRTTFRVAPQLRSHAPIVGDYLPVVDEHSNPVQVRIRGVQREPAPPVGRDMWHVDAVEI